MITSLLRNASRASLMSAAYVFTVLPAHAGAFLSDEPTVGTTADTTDFRQALVNILDTILSFLAILAVIFIVVAGVRLIVSQGEEQEKDKAKKGIIYVIIGLVVILFAKAIISFVVNNVGTN